jgi:hypothetical protein
MLLARLPEDCAGLVALSARDEQGEEDAAQVAFQARSLDVACRATRAQTSR